MKRGERPGSSADLALGFAIVISCAAALVVACAPTSVTSRGEFGVPASTSTSSATATPEATPATAATETAPTVSSTVIGSSVQGRGIVALRFGQGTRKILIIAGIHGDEYGTDVAAALVKQLRAHPELVPADTQIHVIECLNPDGRAAGLRGNANKVDLNLNMPAANWKHTLSPETTAHKRGLNGGSSPGSEPESQALIAYLSNSFDLVISLHSAGGVVDWNGPGGEVIARQMARIAGMAAKHLPVQPYATGTMGQYIPEKWEIPVITVELSSRGLSDRFREALLDAAAGTSGAD